ncbi:MAG: transposase [Chloroflexales bacterium]|nr:transposase [Chloroflexales bacterium]
MHQPVAQPGHRWPVRGELVTKADWQLATAVASWSRRRTEPLLLASSLPVAWDLIAAERKRGAIEPRFRDWKAAGWQWESRQVTDLAHLERQVLLLALAPRVVQCHGNAVAAEILA